MLIISLLVLGRMQSLCAYAIVFIHLGPKVPAFLIYSVNQAYSFNPHASFYVITDAEIGEIKNMLPATTTFINPSALTQSEYHRIFRERTTLDKLSREGFWLHASERFLVLHDFMQYYQLTDVFHLENDTMLYANLEDLLPIFAEHYPHIGTVFDNDERCIPCFVYLRSSHASEAIARCFAEHAHQGINDMYVMGFLKNMPNSPIATLPIIIPDYVAQYGLQSPSGHRTHTPETFTNNSERFNSLFDGAALGQFLGGIDPRNGVSAPGFINESCLFNPSRLTYEWDCDVQGRRIPYAVLNGKKYRINTLHIHSKKLADFLS